MDKGAISSTESALICCALLIAVSSFTLGIPNYFYISSRFYRPLCRILREPGAVGAWDLDPVRPGGGGEGEDQNGRIR